MTPPRHSSSVSPMRHLLFAAVAFAVLTSSSALAQVDVHVAIPVPTITFTAPPPLVVVEPGVHALHHGAVLAD